MKISVKNNQPYGHYPTFNISLPEMSVGKCLALIHALTSYDSPASLEILTLLLVPLQAAFSKAGQPTDCLTPTPESDVLYQMSYLDTRGAWIHVHKKDFVSALRMLDSELKGRVVTSINWPHQLGAAYFSGGHRELLGLVLKVQKKNFVVE